MNNKDDEKIEGLEQAKYKRSPNQPSDSSKEATKTAAKGAANAYLGPMGGKAVDALSKTKLGDAVLTKGAQALEKQPMGRQIAKAADKSGALNAANQAMDAKSGGVGQAPVSSGSAPNSSMNLDEGDSKSGLSGLMGGAFGAKKSSQSTNNSGEVDVDGEATVTDKLVEFIGKHKFKIITSVISLFFIMFIVLIIGGAVVSFAQGTVEFFRDAWDSIKKFVTGDKSTQEWELEYYNKLAEVQEHLNNEYGVCIDVNLITATLTVNMEADHYIEEGKEPETETADGSELGLTGTDYKRMIKQIELLGNMQIKRKYYGLDKEWKTTNPFTGEEIKYCTNPETESEYVYDLVDSEEKINLFEYSPNFISNLSKRFENMTVPVRLSGSLREVASNDIDAGIFQWMTKKANQEKNIAYSLYRPPFTIIYTDENGNTLNPPRVECEEQTIASPTDFAERDIGNLNEMESVYYWNLMDQFIIDYYADYLPDVEAPLDENSEAYQKVKNIIEDIYLLYNEMGPNHTCQSSNLPTVNQQCKNGVTIAGGEEAGTYDLEEYVAGVVEAEMYRDFDMEAKKALAVAARTYVLNYTDSCTKPIPDSSSAQNFSSNISEESYAAARATAGEVLTYNGQIFSSEYDSWNCKGSTTCTYVKLPNRESNGVTITSKYLGRAAGGHGRGMSQIAAADMAASSSNTGSTFYKTILGTFYSEGVQVSIMGGSGSDLPVADGTKDEKLKYLFPDGLPTSDAEMRKYLTTITVPLYQIDGSIKQQSAQIHKDLASDLYSIMQEIANAKFPIKSFGCYSYRGMAGNSNVTSHHSYGVACDINPNENYMIRNGSIISGSYWKPGDDPYSITTNGPVVTAFSRYGWIWGGSWSSSKDYMHFSFTGY